LGQPDREFSMTPKGVELVAASDCQVKLIPPRNSMTPKGVEHVNDGSSVIAAVSREFP